MLTESGKQITIQSLKGTKMKKAGDNNYSDKQLLIRLKSHCVKKHLSRHTLSYPTWNCFKKRIEKDPVFEIKVMDILALADEWWEIQGINNLENNQYNNGMYAKLTSNKSFTRDHMETDIQEIVERMEYDRSTNKKS